MYRNFGLLGATKTSSNSGTDDNSGIHSLSDVYVARLGNAWPKPEVAYTTGYLPRYHDNGGSGPGDAFDKSMPSKGMPSSTGNTTVPSSIHPSGNSNDFTISGYYFIDLGDDIYDNFGYWNIWYNSTNITIPFTTQNQADGEANMTTETFSGGGANWRVKHGFPDVGVWSFHLQNLTSDTDAFRLIWGGGVGSDGSTNTRISTGDATLNSPSETVRLHALENSDVSGFNASDHEQFAFWVIPNKASEFGTGTSTTNFINYSPDDTDPYWCNTNAITGAVTFYLGKGNYFSALNAYVANDLTRT